MDLEKLNGTITALLREIPNPSTGSLSPTWVYMDYPREDVSVPRLSVSQSSGNLTPYAIGDKMTSNTFGQLESTIYDIDVWVKQATKCTIGGLTMGGTQLRDYIGDLVINKIMDNRSTLLAENADFIDVEITNIATQPYVDEFEWHRKTITVRITHFQSHAG